MRSFFFTLAMVGALPFSDRLVGGAERPNVVVILADDLGWNAVGYHSDWARTPNIDRLANEGIDLDRFYVAPMCTPTRAGLLTGRYPIRFGLARAVIPPHRNFGLPTEERTLAEALGDAGYKHRGVFGKWHLGHRQVKWHPLSQGFTHFEGHYNGAIDYFSLEREGERDWHEDLEPSRKTGYATDLIAAAASAFIRVAAIDDSPYFCYVPFNAPHSPFQAKPEDIARHTHRDRTTTEAKYLAMIECMDRGIGKILAAIDATGESDNTQVWFMSDNGGVGQIAGNNKPLHGSKLTTFEGGIRVAACVRWPAEWKGGRKIENTMGYIDLFPTILSSAGVDPAAGQLPGRELDGVDVGNLLAGTDPDFPERDWYSYHGQQGTDKETIAIKTAQWKLIVVGPDVRSKKITARHQVHLYAMPGDLLEKDNVAGLHPTVVEQLFKKLVVYRSLQPENAIPVYREGREGFKPWKNWRLRPGNQN